MNVDAEVDIAATSVADPFRRAVIRLINLQHEMAYLAHDLAELETVLSRQDTAVLDVDALTLDTVRQELVNALRPLAEGGAGATTGPTEKRGGSSLAAEHGGGERIASRFVGRVGDVQIALNMVVEVAEVSGLWDRGQ